MAWGKRGQRNSWRASFASLYGARIPLASPALEGALSFWERKYRERVRDCSHKICVTKRGVGWVQELVQMEELPHFPS